MGKGRLEAFTDGVIAIVITIMVLWANLFLLFWISLVPFVIRWMDRRISIHCRPRPMASSWQ